MPAERRGRAVLFVASTIVIAALVAGGLALRAGAGEGSYRHVVTFSEILSLVLENYVDEPDPGTLMNGAYEGMLAGLDANGAYLDAEETARWKAGEPGDAADPGFSVLTTGSTLHVVASPEGTPAADAGIEPGDQIRTIDGVPVRGRSLPQLLRRLRGKPGSSVRLEVFRPREGFRRLEVDVVRKPRKDSPFRIERQGSVAVLAPRDLTRVAADELLRALRKEKEEGADRLLLDLRNLTLPDARRAAALAGLFTTGPILSLRDKKGKVVETLEAAGPGEGWNAPVAVLVNGATAGAAEALARVLQAKRGAVVYGESTYGLASEPRLFELSGGVRS
jgi:Periplasmic protease